MENYSKSVWVMFLAHKNDAFHSFVKFARKVQNERSYRISSIQTNRGGDFKNRNFLEFCDENSFEHNFSSPYMPQQNGVVERKNHSLQEMAKP